MEVYRRSSWLLLLLGLSLLATTLQGVQGEAESEGPSESECRPYIEKALKELETGEAVDPGAPGDESSKEDIPTVEITTDDSDHEHGDGDDDTDVEGKASTESAEHDETPETDETTDEQVDETKSSENEVAEKSEEHAEDEGTESEEKHEDEDQTQSGEEHAESVEDQKESGEQEKESVEEQAQADEAHAESEEEHKDDEEHKESEEHDEGEHAESEENKEQEADEEHAESTEEHKESTEEHKESAEEHKESAEEHKESAEEQKESAEEHTESVEEHKESAEEHKESAEEHTESAEEHKESAEEHKESAEEHTESTEEPKESAEEHKESAEEHKESAEEHKESAEEHKESAEEHKESAEEHKESTEEHPSEEKAESVEEGTQHDEESKEKEHEVEEEEAAKESVEELAAHEEETHSAEQADAPASVEAKDEHSKEADEHEEGKDSKEEHKDVESSEDTKSSKEDTKSSKEDGKSSGEDTKSGETVAQKSEEDDKDGEKDTGDDKGGKEDAEGDGKESGEEQKDSKEDESAPEEDLSEHIEIPEDLRPRDHIDLLLKLDDDSSEGEKISNKVAEVTLKELKKLYENAIQPLEVLYKYRDLSNRHFGDSEIFSKPLVLFMGPWSGGKSTIINYLLNNEYNDTTLRTGAEPSPAYFNILMYGEEPEVLDGTQLAADFTFSGLQKFGQGLEERLRGLKLPNKLLEKINIVEIPGILEVRKQVSRMFPFNDACQWFIDRADIIFLVYDPSKLDVGPETEAILDQLKGREYQTRIVLNKADQVKPEELMRVQGALIWNISPLMSSAQPPLMYTTSLWSRPYEPGAPVRLLQAQERAFLRDLRTAVDKRIDNKISSARRFAVRVRNHAKMVDCYLTTYYNHKSVFGNRKQISDQIIENPQNYHIYEGLSTLTNISRYDLPDPDVYRDFFKLNPLYDFQQLSSTCTYFRGCPINRLDVAIAYDLPELVGKHKRLVENALAETNQPQSPES